MLVLDAQVRDTKNSPKYLRKNQLIPAVVYGKAEKSRALQLPYQAFRKLFRVTGMTQVFSLLVEGKKEPVLVHDIQYDPLTDTFSHVDFLHVNLKVAVTANVPVEVVGIAPAVKNFGGILTMVYQEIEVKCLPMDIPHEIKIDVSKLEAIGDSIHVSDLNLGDKVEIHLNPEDALITITTPKVVEELSTEIPEDIKAEPTVAEGATEDKKEE
jgi:large subunit ribosomal protein L25